MRRILSLLFLSLWLVTAIGCSVSPKVDPRPLTREQLMDQIASNLQSLAPVNMGEIQLLQIKMSLENLNYSDEELRNFATVVANRAESQQQFHRYAEAMYQALVQQFYQSKSLFPAPFEKTS